jgi:hypothetical protein
MTIEEDSDPSQVYSAKRMASKFWNCAMAHLHSPDESVKVFSSNSA